MNAEQPDFFGWPERKKRKRREPKPKPPEPQFDLFAGLEAKRDGMDRIAKHNIPWMDQALLILHRIPRGWNGLPEEWRPTIIQLIGAPTHVNAWGKLTAMAIERGLIRRNGKRRQMQSKRSKARMTDEYERL